VPQTESFAAFDASPATSVRWSDKGVPPQQQVFFSVLLIAISGFKYTLWGYIGTRKAIVKAGCRKLSTGGTAYFPSWRNSSTGSQNFSVNKLYGD
jgi:hypothetical protein